MATDDLNNVRKVLTSPDTYGTTVLTLVIDRYGDECLGWAPETLRLQLADDFGVAPLPVVLDRLNAAIAVVSTDFFYTDVVRFIHLCNVLSGDEFTPGEFNPADVGECAWGMAEALLLNPPGAQAGPETFDPEIRAYLRETLRAEGFLRAPDVIRRVLGKYDGGQAYAQEWADSDPVMFEAITQSQDQKATEVNDAVTFGLRQLIAQLSALPLREGSAQKLLENLPQSLRQPA